jgi:hypothetical protein
MGERRKIAVCHRRFAVAEKEEVEGELGLQILGALFIL